MRRLAAILLLVSCGNESGSPDAPVVVVDAPLPDASFPDAALLADARGADAVTGDAGVNPARLWLAPRTSDRDLILAETEPRPF